jgi:hypothetical protein
VRKTLLKKLPSSSEIPRAQYEMPRRDCIIRSTCLWFGQVPRPRKTRVGLPAALNRDAPFDGFQSTGDVVHDGWLKEREGDGFLCLCLVEDVFELHACGH